jgi:hypothetical protein
MRYGGKVAAVSAAMACCALLVGAGPASAVPAAGASQPWGAARQVPGLALLPHYTSCAVGGFYSATASFALGFVASGALPQTSRSALTLSAGSVTFGHEQRERITVTVSPQRSGKPSGTVTVKTGGTVLCAVALNSAGKGGCTLSAKRLAVGKHSLAASYGGSVGYSGSGSAAKVVTVVR